MSKTNTGLVSYAKAQVGLPYWYGCYGQTATSSLYSSKKSAYPSYYTANDYSQQYGKRVHDCSGLIKGYLWSSSATATPVYKSSQDKNAAGFYSAASSSKKGKISTIPSVAGLLVFKGSSTSSIHHVGVYGNDGYVYEAKNHANGVKKTKFSSSDWNYWAYCSFIDYEEKSSSSKTSTSTSSKSSSSKTVKATAGAQEYDSSLAGTYKVTANSGLNIRNNAGTSAKKMVAIPKDTKVQNYGYYSLSGKTKWLYVEFTFEGTTYIGFGTSTYLKKV